MNIFASLKKYATKWQEKAVRNFDAEEINAIKVAQVVDSKEGYGLSVCFMAVAGGQYYIPLEQNSERVAGDTIDLNTAKIVTLSREGEKDIYRIRA